MLSPPDDRPAAVLFTARSLPLFRDWLARQHPFPDRLLDAPCWAYAKTELTAGSLFAELPEDPVDAQHHPHFMGMLGAVTKLMLDDGALRAALFRNAAGTTFTFGYHVNAPCDRVRDFLGRRLRVLDADALARERRALPSPTVEATLALAAAATPVTAASPARLAALHDYLQGGGARPPNGSRHLSPLTELFRSVSPLAFNEVHLRALDLVAATPSRLRAIESVLSLADPAFDLHYLWRDALLARGATEESLEDSAVGAWLREYHLTTRSWWLLARAAEDPARFLDRHEGRVRADDLHRKLLRDAAITWDVPRFRAVAEELVARHGARLRTAALLTVLRDPRGERFAELLRPHLDAVLADRASSDQRRLRATMPKEAAP